MSEGSRQAIRGRGASDNPPNRFERLHYADPVDTDDPDDEGPSPRTQLYRDTSRTIISTNDSPDVGFDASITPYRGCEHGCVYCYARPYHEYLGLSAGLDFETKLFVKEDAAELLRKELSNPRWEPKLLSLSGVTDAYQPVERRLGITRACLEVLAEFRNPVSIITKNHLVARDIDILADMARDNAACVVLSVTTLDKELQRTMEPRASTAEMRLDAVRALADAGVPVGVMVAPIIAGLTDHEIPSILNAAAEAGAQFAGYTVLRLPLGVAPLFEQWLDQHVPTRKEKVLNRIREMRDGRLNDSRFKYRMKGEGIFAEQIGALFKMARKKARIGAEYPQLSIQAFRRPHPNGQLGLFG